MKILIHANAPWAATGYGQQCNQLALRLRDAGHDVAISAFYGLQGSVQVWEGIPVYPQGMHPYGNDVITAHAEQHFGRLEDGLIITLVDAWVLPTELLADANVAMWTPVDHEPVPQRVAQALQKIQGTPIAMARNGYDQLVSAGIENVRYAPHGIDTNLMKPMDRDVSRQRLGIPDEKTFVVGMVAANKGTPSRKGFCEAFQAFAAFQKKHPEALLYLHTEVLGTVDGVNLVKLALACGIDIDSVVPMHQYRGFILGMPSEHMPYVYSACDVLLNPALGEGFGIPIVEAQACGTPVIVNDWTAMRELAGPGWKVEGQRFWTSQESWGQTASVPALIRALEGAWKKRGNQKLRDECRRFALNYDADKVFAEHWRPILRDLEDALHRDPEPAPAPQEAVVEVATL